VRAALSCVACEKGRAWVKRVQPYGGSVLQGLYKRKHGTFSVMSTVSLSVCMQRDNSICLGRLGLGHFWVATQLKPYYH
jgi:hypothetical protein